MAQSRFGGIAAAESCSMTVWKPVADGVRVDKFNSASGQLNQAIRIRSERYDPSTAEGRPKRVSQGIAAEGAASQGKDQRPSQAARPAEWRWRPTVLARRIFPQGTRSVRRSKAALRTGPRMADGSGLRTDERSATCPAQGVKPEGRCRRQRERPGEGPSWGSERPVSTAARGFVPRKQSGAGPR